MDQDDEKPVQRTLEFILQSRTFALESMSTWRAVAAHVVVYCRWLLMSKRASTIEIELELLSLVYWFLPHDNMTPCLPPGALSIDSIRFYACNHKLFNV